MPIPEATPERIAELTAQAEANRRAVKDGKRPVNNPPVVQNDVTDIPVLRKEEK